MVIKSHVVPVTYHTSKVHMNWGLGNIVLLKPKPFCSNMKFKTTYAAQMEYSKKKKSLILSFKFISSKPWWLKTSDIISLVGDSRKVKSITSCLKPKSLITQPNPLKLERKSLLVGQEMIWHLLILYYITSYYYFISIHSISTELLSFNRNATELS